MPVNFQGRARAWRGKHGPLCYTAPAASFAYPSSVGAVVRTDLRRFRSEVRTEIIPNSAFHGGEKSEDTAFPPYRARGEGDQRFSSSQRACLHGSHMLGPLSGAVQRAERDEMGPNCPQGVYT